MSQSLFQLWVHIVFSTKERFPFLKDVNAQQRLYQYIKGVCHQLNCNAVTIGGYEDHIHLLVSLHKNMPLSKLIEEIKRSSSKWIKECGLIENDKPFYWQAGYGAFSVSHSNLEHVIQYIRNQHLHHQKNNFKDELIKLFQKHSISYDEKYLWN